MVRGQSVNLDLKVVLNEETAQVLDADGKEILDGDEVDDSVLVRSLQEWSRPGLSDVPLPPQVGYICDATGIGGTGASNEEGAFQFNPNAAEFRPDFPNCRHGQR